MELKDLLKIMIDKEGSDLFLTTGGSTQHESPREAYSYDR